MNKETIRKIVHSTYGCNGKYKCSSYSYCVFGSGKNTAWDANECAADEFVNGIYATCKELGVNIED